MFSFSTFAMFHCYILPFFYFFFFFNDTATTEIYTLSLHDALPIYYRPGCRRPRPRSTHCGGNRSEEHTSELQSPCNLVCRLLLEKKKKIIITTLLAIKNNTNNITKIATKR